MSRPWVDLTDAQIIARVLCCGGELACVAATPDKCIADGDWSAVAANVVEDLRRRSRLVRRGGAAGDARMAAFQTTGTSK